MASHGSLQARASTGNQPELAEGMKYKANKLNPKIVRRWPSPPNQEAPSPPLLPRVGSSSRRAGPGGNLLSEKDFEHIRVYKFSTLKLLDEMEAPMRIVDFNPAKMKNYWGNEAMLKAMNQSREVYVNMDMHKMTSPQVES